MASFPVSPLAVAEGLHVGARFGDYDLMDVLGRGGMAVVYLARQISLDRLVALKTMSASLAADTRMQERFRREARAVAQLDHPGIVSVHDAGVLGGALFYTMDYVNGPTLGRVLRERSLPPRETAEMMRRIADAVGHAHAHGIVHRDLKPANVLLDASGEPHVADFGIAFESSGAGVGLTLTGDQLGTPPYMAPEILASGAKAGSPQGDVYALGATLFQMLTGRTPFVGDSPSKILHLALNEQPPSLRLLNPGVPRDLETICLKCLEKTAAGRYRHGAALSEDLGRFLAGEPILARPVSAPRRVWRWSRRRPVLATVILALALGAAGATLAAFAIDAGRQRAVLAEDRTSEQLWRANLAHAQAARQTTAAGARTEALQAIADAAKFRSTLELRNEAIAALCLDEAHVRRAWTLSLEWTAPVVFDPSLDTYVTEIAPGRLAWRACTDDRDLGRLEVPGTKVAGLPVFSPNGRFLAVRYADKTVRVWEVAAGWIAFELSGRPSPMATETENFGFDIAFRPDGAQLSVGGEHNGLTLHAIPGGAEQGRWTSDFRPSIVRYSPDGTRLAVARRQAAQVQFLDARTLAPQHIAALPGQPICAAWSPAGDRLAVGTRTSRVHFVVPETGEIADTLAAYESGGVGQIVFHPQRPILMGTGSDEGVRFWDIAGGRLFMQLNAVNTEPVIAFDRTGALLCAYDAYSRRASLVEFRASPIYRSVAPPQPVRAAIASGALGVSPDGRWVASSTHGAVQLRDAASGQVIQALAGVDSNDMMTAQFAPDGHSLIVGSTVSGLRRVEVVIDADGKPVLGLPHTLDPEPGYAIEDTAADGRVLLFSDEKETAKIFDPTNPSPALRWPVPKICSAAFSPDGRQALTECGEPIPGDAAVKVWDLAASPPRLAATFGDDPGGRVQCSRAGGWVLVTGDKKTELWRFGSWQRGPVLPADLQGETHHARLSPDGTLLAIEQDGKTSLLATATGKVQAVCEGGASPAGICVNEVFSTDGAQLTMLWQYGSVRVWNLGAMHKELTTLGLDWRVGK